MYKYQQDKINMLKCTKITRQNYYVEMYVKHLHHYYHSMPGHIKDFQKLVLAAQYVSGGSIRTVCMRHDTAGDAS